MQHLTKEDKDVLKKVLGAKEPSESRSNTTFTIFLDEDKYTCDCEDFRFREGSYDIAYKDEQGETQTQQGCKHIARHLRKLGLEIAVTKNGYKIEV